MDFDREQGLGITTVPPDLPDVGPTLEDGSDRGPLKRLLVQDSQRGFFIATDTVQWIEADRHFVKLHLAEGQCHRIRAALSALYERLDQRQFLRINRAEIVNIDFVSELRALNQSDCEVLLRDGGVLRFSRLYRRRFKRLGATYRTSEVLS